MNLNLVIVGVGGQGTLLASRLLGALAQEIGLNVKVSEVHGMSQRGGSVITYVRMGEQVLSPIVDEGGADYVIAFEQLEALRALPYLKQGGTLITNTGCISPMPVIIGAAEYPGGIIEKLSDQCNLIALDASMLAQEAGESRAVNLVLMGVLANELKLDEQIWINAIHQCVPERFISSNLKAFEAGVKYRLG
ncbi:indolepyruvate oxidoreductase subunit beta [Eubacteriales bacterium OttesenSCG-928-N13]|nr:indolepyruvate oxidoreductase subunit beta [Eubacteriales bacterium OttesenSCG-928-N13]